MRTSSPTRLTRSACSTRILPARAVPRGHRHVDHDQRVGVADGGPVPDLPAVQLREPAAHVRHAREPRERVLAREPVQVPQRRLAPAQREGPCVRMVRVPTADHAVRRRQRVQGFLERDAVPREIAPDDFTRLDGPGTRGKGLPHRLEARWQSQPGRLGQAFPCPGFGRRRALPDPEDPHGISSRVRRTGMERSRRPGMTRKPGQIFRELGRDLLPARALDPCERHAAVGRQPRRRRADRGGAGWGRRRLRRAVQPARRGRPPPGPAAGGGAGRRRPRRRGLRQGVRGPPPRRRPRPGVPRLPADRGPAPARRQDPRRLPAAHHRRPVAVRRRGPVPRHRGRGLRERDRGPGVRLAPRALAAGAVAHRGRGPETRGRRAAARHERQLGVRARLPRPRGAAPGVPLDARAGDRGPRVHADPRAPRRLPPGRRLASRPVPHRGAPRRSAAGARPSTSSSARSTRTSRASSRRSCSAGPRRRTSRPPAPRPPSAWRPCSTGRASWR